MVIYEGFDDLFYNLLFIHSNIVFRWWFFNICIGFLEKHFANVNYSKSFTDKVIFTRTLPIKDSYYIKHFAIVASISCDYSTLLKFQYAVAKWSCIVSENLLPNMGKCFSYGIQNRLDRKISCVYLFSTNCK